MRASRTSPGARRTSHVLAGLLALAALLLPLLWVTPAEAALNLRLGSRGTAVRTVEVRLHTLGLLRRVHVDRVYRRATVTSVRTFQRQKRLAVTGRVDRRTWDAIARAAAPKPAAPLPPVPVIAGHRGTGDGGAPEKTLAAMRYAATSADVLETDVRATADGRLVLLHDETLDRTTSCSGPVSQWLLADLTTQCTADGQPIPTFEEFAAYAATTRLSIAPQLKPGLDEAQLDDVVATLQRHGLSARTFVQVDDLAAVRPLLQRDGRLRVLYLAWSAPDPAAVEASGVTVVGLHKAATTGSGVTALHRAGLTVWPWTASTVEELHALWSLGVDGVITDLPREARAIFHP